MRGPTSQRNRTPAVVVGGMLNALGVVRSLARAGVPVFLVATTRDCPAAWSRHCRFVRSESLHGEALIASLEALAGRLACRPALLLTSDDSVATVSAFRERLSSAIRIDLPDAEVLGRLADKAIFQELAEQCGFPVPRGVVVRDHSDLDRVTSLQPPLVIKPADKTRVLTGEIERIAFADSIRTARAITARFVSCAPPILVQEWIDGEDTDIYFTLFACDAESRPVGMFTGRKIVCAPPVIGSTTACVAAPEAAEALGAETRRFIERFAYRGLGSLEFKRDRRTGRYLIIEPTVGRTDWQEEIATLCGVNLPALAYESALGQTASAAPGAQRRQLVWRESREIRLSRGGEPPRTRVIDGYLRAGDPIPALYQYGYQRGALRIWRRACRAIQPSSDCVAKVK